MTGNQGGNRTGKRIMSMILVICLLVTLIPAGALARGGDNHSQNPFSDVSKTDWFYDSVMYVWQNGLFKGTGDTTFSPNGTMTRGMYVTILGRIAEIDVISYDRDSGFKDVDRDAWYGPYVVWAVEKGITKGVGNGLFDPSGLVTRQQMAVMTVRLFDAYGIPYPETVNTSVPKDIGQVADWAKDAVLKLWACGLLSGDEAGNFNPNDDAKRYEAAVFSHRTDSIVESRLVETGAKPKKDEPKDEPAIFDGGAGNNGGTTRDVTVTFVDGDRILGTKTVAYGEAVKSIPDAGITAKDGYILEGWYADSGLTLPFYQDDVLTANKTVYAKYTPLPQPLMTPMSFALLDQAPDLAFDVVALTEEAPGIQSAVTLIPKDASDVIPLQFALKDGVYTIRAQGGYRPGSAYELTLDGGYGFKDKAESIRTASFTIHKDETAKLAFNDGIIYIKDTEELTYSIGGDTVDVLEPKHLSVEDGSAATGTFVWPYDPADMNGIRVDAILCFYLTESPIDRDYINGDYSMDPEVYVKVTNISGTTVWFSSLGGEDIQNLYFIPDVFPIETAAVQSGDGGIVNLADLDKAAFMEMGKDPENPDDLIVDKGDFVVVYAPRGNGAIVNPVYGRIVDYDPITKDITYVTVTLEDIESSMDLFLSQTVSGEVLLKDVDVEELREAISEQVHESGFAEEAAYLMASLATKTDGFKSLGNVRDIMITDQSGRTMSQKEFAATGIGGTFELTDKVAVTVKIETDKNKLHLGDGVQVAIGIAATFSVDVGDDGDSIKIHMSATFVEELALGTDISADVTWKKVLWVIPYPAKIIVNAAIDLKNYTAVSVYVNIYTVEAEEESTWEKLDGLLGGKYKKAFETIQELESKIDQAKGTVEQLKGYKDDLQAVWASIPKNVTDPEQWKQMGKTLGRTDITKDLMGLLNLSTDVELDAGVMDLIQKYHDMMENETDWITLVKKRIVMYEYCLYGIAVGVKADFVVRANINVALGTNLEYQVGKRFAFWIDLYKAKAGSSTMDLIDERFAFQFYVMGKLGLKMGVAAKLYMGIGSGDIASVGLETEFGPYLKLYGIFIYEYSRLRPANTATWIYDERMAGAMYLEFGLYLIVAFDAQAIKLFKYRKEFVNKEYPLLTAGERIFNYGFATKQKEGEVLRILDEDNDSNNGIVMMLPESYRNMSRLDLVNGTMSSSIFGYDRFSTTLSNSRFTLGKDGKISVDVPEGIRYMTCDLTFTWKTSKPAFSKKDMTLTVPLVWTNLADSELKEYFTAKVRVGNDNDGYTTIWQIRVKKNEPFNLPTDEEIKTLIGYNAFAAESGYNLKYASLDGYEASKTENLSIYTDTVYDYRATLRTYDITVKDVENSDGSMYDRVFHAKYGEAFDFSALAHTGSAVSNPDASLAKYTKFLSLDTGGSTDVTEPIRNNLAIRLKAGTVVAKALYSDNSVLATFSFEGIDAGTTTLRIKKGTQPVFDFSSIAAEAQAMVTGISPVIGRIHENTDYVVTCKVNEDAVFTYGITFASNGGSPVPTAMYQEGAVIAAPEDPIKTGYAFDGWYLDESLTERFLWQNMPGRDLTLYAGWAACTYMVTLNGNGGAFNGDDNTATVTVTFGAPYGDMQTPSKPGEMFAGWYTAVEGGKPVYVGDLVGVASDHVLYARWSERIVIDPTSVSLDMADGMMYDGAAKGVRVVAPAGIDASVFDIRYKRNDAAEWSAEAVNAGLYSVKVAVNTGAHPEYAPFEKLFADVMVIKKAQSYFTIADNTLGYAIVGRDNVTIQKVVKNTDYIGDGMVEYAVVPVGIMGNPDRWDWQVSNKFANVCGNTGEGNSFLLAARLKEGENYLASELEVCRLESGAWKSTVPVLLLRPALSFPLNAANGFTYRVVIHTSDIADAGTDARIYAGLSDANRAVSNAGNNMEMFRLDGPKNDFERGDTNGFDLVTTGNRFDGMRPMAFELYYVRAGTKPGWHCDWITVSLYKNGNLLEIGNKMSVKRWFEEKTDRYENTVQFKRSISWTDNFDATIDSFVLKADDHNGKYEFVYSGLAADQFHNSGYNAYDYEFSPVMDILAPGYEDCVDSAMDRITIDKDKLYQKMVANNSYVVEFTATLDFNGYVTTDATRIQTKQIIITRPLLD